MGRSVDLPGASGVRLSWMRGGQVTLAPSHAYRLDVQGLRAIAVVLVVVFHLWPQLLPGGYTGVDVFFVVSGYLISTLLFKELASTGDILFQRFYLRRVRRLLPASLFTLAVITLATPVLLPETQWRAIATEVIASALYSENWWLFSKAVDYLAEAGAGSPLQHFWSLSVEEQFYFVWPGLIWVSYRIGRRALRGKGTHGVLLWILVATVVVSLSYSVYTGMHGDSAAYFSTFTRVWQLACGALLAVRAIPRATHSAIWWLVAGLLAILSGSFVLNQAMSYPGYVAILPTVGACMVLHGGMAYRNSVLTRWLGARPVQFVGGISYSLYLWHWPLIVFAQHQFGEHLGPGPALVVMVASVGMATLSKRLIEDPFRHGEWSKARQWGCAFAATGLCVCMALVLQWFAGNRGEASPRVAGDYPGAAAMAPGAPRTVSATPAFVPALVNVERDVATAYQEGCIQDNDGTEVKTCRYGREGAPVRIAIVGDSHAVHWLPAFQALARLADIEVVGITKTGCSPAGVPLYNRLIKGAYASCNVWTKNVLQYLKAQDFDHIVLSQSPGHMIHGKQREGRAGSVQAIADGLSRTWNSAALRELLIVINPTPWQPTIVRDCAAVGSYPFRECTGLQSEVLGDTALRRFAGENELRLVDLTRFFCKDGECPAVIGNVFVYRDSHHVTSTYMRTFAPLLLELFGIDAVPSSETERFAVEDLRPSLDDAGNDRSGAFAEGCVASARQASVRSCRFGKPGGTRIAMVGDSTGANFLPALEAAAESEGWEIRTYFKDSCLFGSVQIHSRILKRGFRECRTWSEGVLAQLLADPPDAVLFSQSHQYRDPGSSSVEAAKTVLASGVRDYWSKLDAAGIQLAMVAATPWLRQNPVDCLRTARHPDDCAINREGVLHEGVLPLAQAGLGDIVTIDLTDAFCSRTRCEVVKDGILVYRDGFQPTATFSRSLAPVVVEKLKPALPSNH